MLDKRKNEEGFEEAGGGAQRLQRGLVVAREEEGLVVADSTSP